MNSVRTSITARVVATVRSRVPRVSIVGGEPAIDDRLSAAAGLRLPLPLFGTSGAYLRGRTRFFDDAVVEAIADGIEQIVLVGAGYDGRAFRYRTPETRWFEVDHPATQNDKRALLRSMRVDCSHMTFVGCDLAADDLGAALRAAGHDAARSTIYLAEAVLPYLTPAAVERALHAMSERRGSRGRLAAEFGLRPHDVTARTNVCSLRILTALIGEPILTITEPSDALELLRRSGWRPRQPDPTLDPRAQERITLWVVAD